jgi:hypothetical protein
MANFNGLLEPGFAQALLRASNVGGIKSKCRNSDDVIPAGLPQTEVEMVADCLDLYRRRQRLTDLAVGCIQAYMNTRHGLSNAHALEAALKTSNNPLSAEIATHVMNAQELLPLRASLESSGLQAMGIGVSAGAYAVVGVLAGAEVLVHAKGSATGRTWHAASVETGLGTNAGFEFSFWDSFPLTGCIFGLLVDVGFGIAVRFTRIRQKAEGDDTFEHAGWSIQWPFGTVVPFAAVGAYLGHQDARERVPRFTLTLAVDGSTDDHTLVVNTSSTVTLTIDTGVTSQFATGATITIRMPSFFTTDEISAMTISSPPTDWTFSNDGTDLLLTYTGSGTTWDAGSSVSFDIGNVESAGSTGEDVDTGNVLVTIDRNIEKTLSNRLYAELDVAWAQFQAKIEWTAAASGGTSGLVSVASTGGCVTGYSQAGDDVVQLTTATDANGNEWVLGYIFNYGSNGTTYPEARAVMYKSNASTLIPGNEYTGQWVTEDTTYDDSTAAYADNSNYGDVSITVTFGSSCS